MRNTLKSILKNICSFVLFLLILNLDINFSSGTSMQQCRSINCDYTHTHTHAHAPTRAVTVWHTGRNFAPLRCFISWKLLGYLKEMTSLLPNSFIFLESERCDLWLSNSEIPNHGEKKKRCCNCQVPLRLLFVFVFLAQCTKTTTTTKSGVRSRKGEHKSTQCLNLRGTQV